MPNFVSKFLVALGLSVALFSGLSWAGPVQDNPFGGVPNVDGSSDTGLQPIQRPPISLALSESTRLIIRTVQDSNPQSPTELAKAVRTMMDLEVFDQAKFFLAKLVAQSPTDKQMFEMQTTVGADFFLALFGSPEMQPEGRAFATNVFESAKRAAYDPERVASIVKAVSDENISTRSEAFRMLRRLGAPGAAALLNVFTQPDRANEFPFIRGALAKFGKQAIDPLVGGARANHLQMQVESVRALEAYDTADAVDAMSRVYFSPRFPESVRRKTLEAILTQDGERVGPQDAEARLYQHAEDFLTGRRQMPVTANGLVTIWRWAPTPKKLEALVVRKVTAERISAADRAEDLFEIAPDTERNRQLYLLTKLEAAKRIAGSGQEIDVQKTLKKLGGVTELEVQDALSRALELDLVPAAVGACEVLEEIGSSQLFTTHTNRPCPLVDAILYGNRHLQYAALKAVAAIDPKQAFAGSSYVTSLAVYLAKSEGVTAGLVGHNRIGKAQSFAAALHQSGIYGRTADTSREFFKLATQNPDLGLLLITDSLSMPDYIDLAQQLRSDWRTKRIPIGILVRDDRYSRRANLILRNDPYLLVLPASLDSETVGSYVRRLTGLYKPWPISRDERRMHAMVAIRWLAKVASNRDEYGFWDLVSYQEQLTSLLYIPGFAQDASQILSAIGTPLAQRALVDFASQSNFPLLDRQFVADAFVKSVTRSGTLLTTAEIGLQYKRYNASETEPKSTQQLLGKMLDAIEARRDRISFSD